MIKYSLIFTLISLVVCSCTQPIAKEEADVTVDSTLTKNVQRKNVKQGDVIKTIYFEKDGYKLSAKDIISLDSMAELWRESGFLKVFGFTDTLGTEKHNDTICEKRTMAIFNYLKTKSGKEDNDAYVDWLGESAEVYDLHFAAAHPQQNCVDIWLIR